MTCCLVHYLKGVRAYQRRIRELKELVETWEDRVAYLKGENREATLRAENWRDSARKWRCQAEDANMAIGAAQATAKDLRGEIYRLQARIAELEERDREEKGGVA